MLVVVVEGEGAVGTTSGEQLQHHPHHYHHNLKQGSNSNQNISNTANGNEIQQQQMDHLQLETHLGQVSDLHVSHHLINNPMYLTSSGGNNDNQSTNNGNQQQSNGQRIGLQKNVRRNSLNIKNVTI